jgi:hypothetical protein
VPQTFDRSFSNETLAKNGPLSGSAGRNPANLSTPGVKPLTFSLAALFKWLHISKIIQKNIYLGLAYILLKLK